jgi:hypothetical protein
MPSHRKWVEPRRGASLRGVQNRSRNPSALRDRRGLVSKHAVNRVDRLLRNAGIHVWSYFRYRVPYVVGPLKAIQGRKTADAAFRQVAPRTPPFHEVSSFP